MQDDQTTERPKRLQDAPAAPEAEVAYPASQLLGNASNIFDQPSWVLEGALASKGIDLRGNVTKSEAQAALQEFLQTPDRTHVELLERQKKEGQ